MDIYSNVYPELRYNFQLTQIILDRVDKLYEKQEEQFIFTSSPIKQRIDSILDITNLARSKSSEYGQNLTHYQNQQIKQTETNDKYDKQFEIFLDYILRNNFHDASQVILSPLQISILDFYQTNQQVCRILITILENPIQFSKTQEFYLNYKKLNLGNQQVLDIITKFYYGQEEVSQNQKELCGKSEQISKKPKKLRKETNQDKNCDQSSQIILDKNIHLTQNQLTKSQKLTDQYKVTNVPLRITSKAQKKQSMYSQKLISSQNQENLSLDRSIQFRMFSKSNRIMYTKDLDDYIMQQISK